MASTTEALLLLELMATGEKNNTWGQILNLMLTLIGEAVAGMEVVAVTGGTTTLTDTSWLTNQSRNAALKFTGVLTSNSEIVIPSRSKVYIVWNATSGAFTQTVKTSGGTGFVVPQGGKIILFCDGTDTYEIPGNLAKTGKQTLWIPAQAMRPSETSGCGALTAVQISSGKPIALGLPFDASSVEYAEFFYAMPKSWDKGTVTFRPYWTTNDTTTNGVAWALQGVAMADNDAVDGTYGTAITVTDANQSASYRTLVGAESAAVTIAGTPGDNEYTAFRFYRDTANGSDTLAADAILLGIQLFVTTNAGNDA